MGFLDLFVVASMPILKVLLVTALGLYLALDRVDVMGEATRKQLNRVSYSFYYPESKRIRTEEEIFVFNTRFAYKMHPVHACDQLVYLVFNPALVGSNLAKTVTSDNILLL